MSSRRSNLVCLRIATLRFSSLAECHTQIIQVVSTPHPYFSPSPPVPLILFITPEVSTCPTQFFTPPNFMPIFPEEKFPQKVKYILVSNFIPTSKGTAAVCVALRHFSISFVFKIYIIW